MTPGQRPAAGRSALAPLLVTVVALVVTGCSAEPVRTEPPRPEPAAAAACEDLAERLPDAIEEGERRTVEPESPYTAAWADPAIVLSCGVAEPPEYEPTSELVIINAVDWLVVEHADHYSFFATGRVAWVRVDVPADYAPPTFALTELSDVVARIPLTAGPSAASATSTSAISSATHAPMPAAPPA